jgi:hypothetical protein
MRRKNLVLNIKSSPFYAIANPKLMIFKEEKILELMRII